MEIIDKYDLNTHNNFATADLVFIAYPHFIEYY